MKEHLRIKEMFANVTAVVCEYIYILVRVSIVVKRHMTMATLKKKNI